MIAADDYNETDIIHLGAGRWLAACRPSCPSATGGGRTMTWEHTLVNEDFPFEDGAFMVTDRPGHGYTLDHAAVDRTCEHSFTLLRHPPYAVGRVTSIRTLRTDWHDNFYRLGHQPVQLYLQETIMAESRSASPPPEDMHWGISYWREDLQEVKQDLRDFRREVSQEFADVRKEMAQQIADVRRDLRHNLFAMIGVSGVFATIIMAFIEFRFPAG